MLLLIKEDTSIDYSSRTPLTAEDFVVGPLFNLARSVLHSTGSIRDVAASASSEGIDVESPDGTA